MTWRPQRRHIELKDFLPSSSAEAVLDAVIGRRDDFKLVTGNGGRHNYILSNTATSEPGLAAEVIDQVTVRMADLLRKLRLQPLRNPGIDWAAIAYTDGSFFHPHKDNVLGNYASRMSFIYYVHRQPRAFQGGTLALFSSRRGSRRYPRLLEPEHNSVVFFPSNTFHEVQRVSCSSGDFGDSRFAISGWVKERHPQQAVAGALR